MEMLDYTSKIQSSKTFKKGFVDIKEYSRKTFCGIAIGKADIPPADSDHDIIVMDIRGDRTVINTILKGVI